MNEYINKLFEKIHSLSKKDIIIFIIVLIIIIIFFIGIGYIQEERNKKEIQNKEYNSFKDFKTAKEYIIYSGNEYIKEEKSKEENIETDIYLTFKVNLFEGEESNEEFYTDLINIVANTQAYSNYRLIDEKKELIITVICSKEQQTVTNVYYNGIENYFSIENSKKSLKNYNNNESEFEINSTIINQLIENDWLISKINFGNRNEIKNNYFIYNNFMVRNISKKVYNIVFFKDYQEPIINGIKVGTKQEDIKLELGEPDFESLGIIGYKSKEIYVFFGENTASIYRVEKKEKNYNEFIDLVEEFRNNKNSKQLVAKLTDIWDDYNDFEVKEDNIYVEYALKGVVIQFNITNEHGIILYNNYIGEIEKGINISDAKDKDDYELPKYTYVHTDEDLVLNSEINRAFKFEEISS